MCVFGGSSLTGYPDRFLFKVGECGWGLGEGSLVGGLKIEVLALSSCMGESCAD